MAARGKKDGKETKKAGQTGTQSGNGSVANANPANASPDEESTVNLSLILQELREFRQDNKSQLKEIEGEIKKTNTRLGEAEDRIEKAEERIQNVEGVLSEMLKLHAQMEAKLTEQESRSRRENIRLYGIPEGAENDSATVTEFIEKLLGDNLDIADSTTLHIERAHRSLGPRPPPHAQPRSIVVKFASFRTKEMVLSRAWQKKGLMWDGHRINVDNDYPPRILQRRKEYAGVRKVLKERDIRFQTLFPARLRVKYQEGDRVYNTVEEATEDLAARGFNIVPIKQPESMMERLQQLSWQRSGRARRVDNVSRTPHFKERLQAYRREDPPQTMDSG